MIRQNGMAHARASCHTGADGGPDQRIEKSRVGFAAFPDNIPCLEV
jgi:hypothetical protein